MESLLLVGQTDADGNLVITQKIYHPRRLVRVRWLAGDFANGVDATLIGLGVPGAESTLGLAAGTLNRTVLTLTNADDDAWHDVDEIVDDELKLTVSNGGNTKSGGCIAYFDEAAASIVELGASEIVLGKVAGTALVVTPTITVDTAVYAAGDSVGGKITLPNAVRVSGGSSLLYSIHIFDRSNQKPTGNILLFNADPTAATTTDNAAFVYSTDDFKQLTRVPIAASDYVSVNSKASAGLTNIGRMVKAATGTSLYAVFVTDGAPDFVATTDLQIIFNFIPVD